MNESPSNELIATGKVLAAVAAAVNPAAALAVGLGAAGLEYVSYLSAKKQEEILRDILLRLRSLEETGILELKPLLENESFTSLLVTAAKVATHTQRKEKLIRLKNAVVNCAISRSGPSPAQVDSFFHLFDQLTEEHFVILTVIAAHEAEFRSAKDFKQVYKIFMAHCSELAEDAFGHYLYDLKYRRILRISSDISDEDGLAVTPTLGLSGKIAGPSIVVTSVGLDLLRITESKADTAPTSTAESSPVLQIEGGA